MKTLSERLAALRTALERIRDSQAVENDEWLIAKEALIEDLIAEIENDKIH